MNEDKELAMWKAEWATLGGSADFVKELAARAKKVERNRKLGLGVQVVICASVCAFATWFAIAMKGAPTGIAFCAGNYFFGGVVLTRSFTTFRRVDSSAKDVATFVKATNDRFEAGLKMLDFQFWSTIVLAVACYAWMTWLALSLMDHFIDVVPSYVGVTVILAGLFWWYRRAAKIIRRKRDRFAAVVAERTAE